jgi:beta-barrel assembly-enhancing protease
MRRVILALLLTCLPWSAQAFNINLDLGKLKDMVGKAQNLREVDENGEVEIGSSVSANLLGVAPLVKNDQLQSYVNRIGQWLAMQTERPDLVWHFGVMDTDTINAFAAPGGYVFITRGLLLKMHSEAELAGVLAHEISHVLKRHHLKAIQKSSQVGLLADAASLAAGGSRHSDVMKKAINAGTELYARGLDKDDEFEADRMGVVIAARAGYDPYALLAVLQTLDAMNPQDGSLALMFKTHPLPAQRLQLLDGAMTGKMDSYASQPQVAERFRQAVH